MADQPITGLPSKTASGVASTDKMLGIDSAEGYQILVRDVAKYIIENCNVSTLAGAVQTPKQAIDGLNSNGLYDRGPIRESVNLNNLQSPGLYYCNATSGSNFPTGLSYNGVLIEVSLFANSGGVCQVCIDAVGSSKRIWRRYFVNNAWSDWVKQPERSEIETLNSKTDASITTSHTVVADSTWLRKNGGGSVTLCLDLTLSSDVPAYGVVASLPSGYRPYKQLISMTSTGKEFDVTASGNVRTFEAMSSGSKFRICVSYLT